MSESDSESDYQPHLRRQMSSSDMEDENENDLIPENGHERDDDPPRLQLAVENVDLLEEPLLQPHAQIDYFGLLGAGLQHANVCAMQHDMVPSRYRSIYGIADLPQPTSDHELDSAHSANPAVTRSTSPLSLLRCAARVFSMSAVQNGANLATCQLVESLPGHLQLEVYAEMVEQGKLCHIARLWADLDTMLLMLSLSDRRKMLSMQCAEYFASGLLAGRFLCDAGWFAAACACLRPAHRLAALLRDPPMQLTCALLLLESSSGYCEYDRAKDYMFQCEQLLQRCEPTSLDLAAVYNQYSLLHFYLSDYGSASKWAFAALKQLGAQSPLRTKIEVCRSAAKVLVVRRKFQCAKLLISHAVQLAWTHYDKCAKYPAPLLDLGFYLLNRDRTGMAVKMYRLGLSHRVRALGGHNLKVLQAHEDLAYALYVLEYNTGNFAEAKRHADLAIEIGRRILPDDHLLLASSRRVKALIVEEMAIDCDDGSLERRLLVDAERLHLAAMGVCRRAFGEDNVQTAKHYGNLGRLYQSMGRHDDAVAMHQKAIHIKEKLLGRHDYEVALSLGHLASLYNYDLSRYQAAEQLYLRSIDIGVRHFGSAFSGLEYDYRGLVHIYVALCDAHRANEFVDRLAQWRVLRENMEMQNIDGEVCRLREAPGRLCDVLEQFWRLWDTAETGGDQATPPLDQLL